MAKKKTPIFIKLLKLYKKFIIIWIMLALLFVGSAFLIYILNENISNTWKAELANFLMTVGQTIIGAGLIGGGIGGVVNFIFEEFKQEEEEAKKRLKSIIENREKRKAFRKKMQNKLQIIHDEVELARVLIKSHKSGKTYGEQIRSKIMPSLISLKDFKRRLHYVEDENLKENLPILQVSLTYMTAYLSALMGEFENNYLNISNLQNYQEALVSRMRTLFTEIAETENQGADTLKKKKEFLDGAENFLGHTNIPSNVEVVWQEMEKLDYLNDFIGELRNEKGKRSLYYQYFLKHYFHCSKLIKSRDSSINEKICTQTEFQNNIKELSRIEKKKNSDDPLTNRDSLTRRIMENELHYDFSQAKFSPHQQ